MFKAEKIFDDKPLRYIHEFLDLIKMNTVDPDDKSAIVDLYSTFLVDVAITCPHLDAERSDDNAILGSRAVRLLGMADRYLEAGSAHAFDSSAKFAENLIGVFNLYPGVSNRNALTGIVASANKNNFEVTKKLITGICDADGGLLNAMDKIGETALTTAFDHCPELISFLIELGADVNCANTRGQTPLALAIRKRPELILALLEQGANPLCVSDDGFTPLGLCFDKTIDPALIASLIAAIPRHCKSFMLVMNRQRESFLEPQTALCETLGRLKRLASEISDLTPAAIGCLWSVEKIAFEFLNPLDIFLLDMKFINDAPYKSEVVKIKSYIETLLKTLDNPVKKIEVCSGFAADVNVRFVKNYLNVVENPIFSMMNVLCEICRFEDSAPMPKFFSDRLPDLKKDPSSAQKIIDYKRIVLNLTPDKLRKRFEICGGDAAMLRVLEADVLWFLEEFDKSPKIKDEKRFFEIFGVILRLNPVPHALELANDFWPQLSQAIVSLILDRQTEICALYATGDKKDSERADALLLHLCRLICDVDMAIVSTGSEYIYEPLYDLLSTIPKEKRQMFFERTVEKNGERWKPEN